MDSSENTEYKETGERTVRRHELVIVASGIYFGWLMWLAYVAWVNVQAGNQ